MSDPLAGYRQSINERKVTVLKWPATAPCPVDKGERFRLQSCEIEIEKVSRKIVKGQPAEWHVTFIRHERDVPQLLRFTPPVRPPRETDLQLGMSETEKARREGNYTSSLRSASPHEPESVGPDWKDTRVAEREVERQAARAERMSAERNDAEVDKAAARLKQVGRTLGRKGVDMTPALADIYERLAQMERDAA